MHIVPVDVTGPEESLKEFAEAVVSTVSHVDYCFLAAGVFLCMLAAWKDLETRVSLDGDRGYQSPAVLQFGHHCEDGAAVKCRK